MRKILPILSGFLGLALLLTPALALAGDLQIVVARDRTGSTKTTKAAGKFDTGGTIKAKGTDDKWVYDVSVTNNSFNESAPLRAEYIIFVERQELGKKAGTETLEQVRGTSEIPALASRANASFKTEEVTLRESGAGFVYYTNGGRVKAKDTIKGVWVKLFDGEKEVAEYANPSTIKTREKW